MNIRLPLSVLFLFILTACGAAAGEPAVETTDEPPVESTATTKQAVEGNSDSRNIEFEMIKNEVQKVSQTQR